MPGPADATSLRSFEIIAACSFLHGPLSPEAGEQVGAKVEVGETRQRVRAALTYVGENPTLTPLSASRNPWLDCESMEAEGSNLAR